MAVTIKQVLAAGHTVGTHTWSHVNLNSKKMTEQQVKDEMEKGFSAVKMALGQPPAPFFRFPQLQHNPAAVTYLGTRNVAMFSTDLDSFDFRSSSSEQIINTVMTKVDKLGKGIILIECSDRNGPVVGIAMVKPEDEVMLITDGGQTIRTPVEGIRETGRNTQGVKLMSIADDERVVAIEPIGEGAATGLDDEAGPESQAPGIFIFASSAQSKSAPEMWSRIVVTW